MNDLANCPSCAEVVVGEDRFCSNCGTRIWHSGGNPNAEASADRLLLEALRRATIGEYEIREELGRGGMATVFLAHDMKMDRKVAVKMLSPHLQMLPGMATRFLREAQTAAGMEHPNIIPIYTYRENADVTFFTMRYVRGASLSAVANEVRQLPISSVRALLWDIGGALSFAHAHGVLHRDVKPGNVLLGRDGSVVVTDFGIAKPSEGHALTLSGELLGTPAYMSPEQCRGSDISFASDQYSLGVMAFELLAGRLPFASLAAGELMAQHLTELAPHISDFRPDCPADLASSVMRMLLKNPSKRFASIDEALSAAHAVPVLPSDPARLQIRTWAESLGHVQSFADTPLSPLIGSLQSAPAHVVSGAPPLLVAETPVSRPFIPAAHDGAKENRSSGLKIPRQALLGAAAVALMVPIWLLMRAKPRPPEAPRGTLRVENLPPSGTVFVDGAPIQDARVEIAAGVHRVRVEAPGFVVLDTAMDVVQNDTSSLVFGAVKIDSGPSVPDRGIRKGTLVIIGLPDGGRAVVDGRAISGVRVELAPGRHTIRLLAPGFVPAVSVVQVSAGATRTMVFASSRISVGPTPPVPPAVSNGVLMLRVRPFAKVFVDGALRSEDEELVVISIGEGRHALRFEKRGYVTLEASVTVTAGDTLKKLFTIQPESP